MNKYKKDMVDYSNRFINDLRREYRLLQKPTNAPWGYSWFKHRELAAINKAKYIMSQFRALVLLEQYDDAIHCIKSWVDWSTWRVYPEYGPLMYRLTMFLFGMPRSSHYERCS